MGVGDGQAVSALSQVGPLVDLQWLAVKQDCRDV